MLTCASPARRVRAAVVFVAAGLLRGLARNGRNAYAADKDPADRAQLRAEVERLKGIVPDQSHAMADVGYHFANLWFAGEQDNWPLADFFVGEVSRT